MNTVYIHWLSALAFASHDANANLSEHIYESPQLHPEVSYSSVYILHSSQLRDQCTELTKHD